ncbi:MAG: SH3 domain-containing protein [Leptolyngbyaceae cyanobacterium CSU_1_3]|nr:SH3 domain-containing protein [Leptolyngbyaceae cyanobacterium CSU_1_3]
MENFGYIHLAVEHEDPSPEPTIRSLEELGLTLPTSARVGVAGFLVAASIMAMAQDATALILRGNRGGAVSAVQSALNSRGYTVAVDGVFGRQTESALVAFQRDRGLSADGIVGSATASALGVASSGSGNSTGGGGTPTGTVTVSAGSGVNIRSGPGTNYAIVGGLGNGARVSTFGSSNGWLRVNGGWISSSFTSGGGGGSSSSGGGGAPSGTVTVLPAIGVHIRSGPGTNFAIVGGLNGGARVSTFGSSNGWYRVNGGWISSSYAQ